MRGVPEWAIAPTCIVDNMENMVSVDNADNVDSVNTVIASINENSASDVIDVKPSRRAKLAGKVKTAETVQATDAIKKPRATAKKANASAKKPGAAAKKADAADVTEATAKKVGAADAAQPAKAAKAVEAADAAEKKPGAVTRAKATRAAAARGTPARKVKTAAAADTHDTATLPSTVIPFPTPKAHVSPTVQPPDADLNLSNERSDVARRVLELSETIDEAIVYMRSKLPVFAVPEDERDFGIGISAAILKDIGEGLISLANAVNALNSMEKTPDEDSGFLDATYDAITGTVDTMIDAYLDNRAWDYAKLASALHSTFKEYSGRLSRCYRGMAII